MTPNVSDSSSMAPTNTSSLDMEMNNDQDSRDLRKENSTDIDSTFSKYRRNGIDIDYADRWEEERKNYMIDLPNPRTQYEDEFYPYPRERARYNEKIHHVRVQGCPHYSRDVSRDEVTRSGILQGWLGAARGGTRNNDDKRYETTPFYMTTAVAKTASSYRNQAANTNRQQGEYENTYDKQNTNYLSSRPKYTNNYNKVKGSASKDYYNFQGGNYEDDRNVNSWQSPQQDKHNRVVYYEYNLDDSNRRPNVVYYPQNGDYYSANYDQCELEYDENYRKPTKNQYMYNRNRYPTTNIYGGTFVPQSRLSTSFSQMPNDRQYSPYYAADDNYQSRNVDRGDTRNPSYDFPLPYAGSANERLQFPAIPSTHVPQSQFIPESVPERQDIKADTKSVPFGGHRFNFQTN